MDFGDVWQLVAGGGDVAIYAVLYYAHAIQGKVNALEIKHSGLKNWVSRLDDKIERRNSHT